MRLTDLSVLLLLSCTPASVLGAQTDSDLPVLWEIGKSGEGTGQFLLGPWGYSQYDGDGVYLVGHSKSREDWPYVHPGPSDLWAGSRRHTFTVHFALEKTAAEGECLLLVNLADTHAAVPPKIEIRVNDFTHLYETPAGGNGASIWGDLSGARKHTIEVTLPADRLAQGTNEIGITTLGGSWMLYDSITLKTPPGVVLGTLEGITKVKSTETPQVLVEKEGELHQIIRLHVEHLNSPTTAVLHFAEIAPKEIRLERGRQTIEIPFPAVDKENPVLAELKIGSETIWKQEIVLEPVRRWEVYLLAHSHVDIGYTQLQSVVESLHWKYFDEVIEGARNTVDNPEGARFKWNVEVLWAVDSYLKRSSPEKRGEFIEAVKKGWIGLDALYGNELTGLCRPEEMVRLTDCACRLREEYGIEIDSAMISDVPGYSWSVVPVLAQSGVKYFSIGPNVSARIGYTLSDWGDRPFYWVSQSMREKVLCWVAGNGYSWFHSGRIENDERILQHVEALKNSGYPYDIVQARYSIGGDNGPPDFGLCEYVQRWNEKYAYPKLRIATTREMFHALEDRYAEQIPSVEGDFTPYWEDGAASSARETALNRNSAERLVQGEALYSILDRSKYPNEKFYEAWRNVILYDEHTWGAHNSITEPDSDFAKGQWYIKQAFALDADRQSKELQESALTRYERRQEKVSAVLVFNTSSWRRTDLATVPADLGVIGDAVFNSAGEAIPSQRLSTGDLVFLARDIPPYSAKRFLFRSGEAGSTGTAHASGTELSAGSLRIVLDEETGAIALLEDSRLGGNLVDATTTMGLNDYFYVPGPDPKNAIRNGSPKIEVGESGPLVASLIVTSTAPGCYHLTREIRLVDGLGRVEIINNVNKRPIREKEGVHFAFPFNVSGGEMRMDIGWGVIRPDADQISGACKNWFTVQRWVDISNQDFGVTWATVDAPLVEIGSMTAETPWIRFLGPTQTLFSYVMNNYWFTNYKADQEDETIFRYAIQPHGRFDSAAANRFGTESSQPLVVVPVDPSVPEKPSFLRVEPSGVLVSALKPTRDGKGWIVRLYGGSGRPEKATLAFADRHDDLKVFESDLSEEMGPQVTGGIEVPPYGMVTVCVMGRVNE